MQMTVTEAVDGKSEHRFDLVHVNRPRPTRFPGQAPGTRPSPGDHRPSPLPRRRPRPPSAPRRRSLDRARLSRPPSTARPRPSPHKRPRLRPRPHGCGCPAAGGPPWYARMLQSRSDSVLMCPSQSHCTPPMATSKCAFSVLLLPSIASPSRPAPGRDILRSRT